MEVGNGAQCWAGQPGGPVGSVHSMPPGSLQKGCPRHLWGGEVHCSGAGFPSTPQNKIQDNRSPGQRTFSIQQVLNKQLNRLRTTDECTLSTQYVPGALLCTLQECIHLVSQHAWQWFPNISAHGKLLKIPTPMSHPKPITIFGSGSMHQFHLKTPQ